MDRLAAVLERRRVAGPRRLAAGPPCRAAVRRAPDRAPHQRRLRGARLAAPRPSNAGSTASRARSASRSRSCWPAARAPAPRPCVPRWTGSTRIAERAAARRADAAAAAAREARGRRGGDRRRAARSWTARRTTPPTWPSTCATSWARSARGGVEPHLVGQQALWAGMQDLTKEDLETRRDGRLPDRAADPARGVRLARGRGAAARARVRQRHDHRRRASSSSPRPPRCRCS